MKIFLTLVFFILLSFPAIAQRKTDVEKYRFKGKVKTVESFTTWLIKDGKDVPPYRLPSSVTNFDSKGNLTERVVYNRDGKLSIKNIYTFDAKGNNIEYRVFENDGSPGIRITYKYNEQGKIIESADYYWTGKLSGTIIYTYDEKGNQSSRTAYAPDGNLRSKNVLTYDAKGRQTEALQYEGESLRSKIIYKYDNKDRVVELEMIEIVASKDRPDDEPFPGKVVTAYDDRKRTKKVTYYAPDGSLRFTTLFIFNEHGDEIEKVMSKSNHYAAKIGERISGLVPDKTNNSSGMVIQRFAKKYAYDSHGNWTKRTFLIPPTTESGVAPTRVNYIEEQIITYY